MSNQVIPPPLSGPTKYLTAYFEGYFMCRLATDPDPTNEPRGMSGYTMALSTEQGLDQVIRLQADEAFLKQHLRPPAQDMGLRTKLLEGVRVNSVTFDGQPWNDHPLMGASVSLLGRDEPFKGPTFESRNDTVGSDDTMSFVIDPFHLQLKQTRSGAGREVIVRAEDYIDPLAPQKELWEILDPASYGRRLSSAVAEDSQEVATAINVFDLYGYFRDRRRFLRSHIDELETQLSRTAEDEIMLQQFRSRLYQLEFWGDRVISKLGTQVSWAFEINGPKEVEGDLGGTVDRNQAWPVQLWFGGWDGDLLTGYARGSLSMPFTKTQNVSG